MGEQIIFLHPRDSRGTVVDASFTVQPAEGPSSFEIFFASRGGTKGTAGARNIEYHIGLRLLLERLRELGGVLISVVLDSVAARKLPREARVLNLSPNYNFPIDLGEIAEVEDLRKAISEAQRNVAAASNRAPTHGNRVRSIRLAIEIEQESNETTAAALAYVLEGGELVRPTYQESELRLAVLAHRQKKDAGKPIGVNVPPFIKMGDQKRFARSAAVIAYVLRRAGGRCELCGSSSFETASGEGYFEIHHVHQLAWGGSDAPENAVAVCADCHRKLHFAKNKRRLSELLYSRIGELRRHEVQT